jgi:Tol biopolymer transport system component
VRLSPDGTHGLFHRVQERSGTYDLWQIDVAHGTQTRLTSGEGSEFSGIWLPDGKSVVFAAPRGGPPHLYRLRIADGSETQLIPAGAVQLPQDVSPDGKQLLYAQRSERGDLDCWTLPLTAAGPPSVLLGSTANEYDVRVSPDGRQVSFTSDESGRSEVYVAPLPDAVVRTRVSKGGGQMARWNPDGSELVFLAADRRLVSVPVGKDGTLGPGARVSLFALGDGPPLVDFEVPPGGRRFLVTLAESVASEQPYSVLVHWPATLGRPL